MKLPILQYGDPILRAKGRRIEKIDERIRQLTQDMIETMHAANGVGLAAQQVGEALQLTVLDVSQVEDRPSTMKLNGKDVDPRTAMPLILINPEIKLAGETEFATEACLSFPEISGQIERAKSVIARAAVDSPQSLALPASGCRSCTRTRWPRFVSFCIRLRRLDKVAFTAEFIRSIKRTPFR